MRKTLFALTAAMAVSAGGWSLSAAGPIPQLNGIMVSYDEEAELFPGLWALPTEASGSWNMKFYMNPSDCSFYSGVPYEQVYYSTRFTSSQGTPLSYVVAYSFDCDPEAGWGDWTNTHDATYLPYDQAYNPYDHRIYGIFANQQMTGMVFATATYEHNNNSRIHPIKELEGNWIALAAAPDGQMYAIKAEVEGSGYEATVTGSALYKIDRLTGDVTFIGETGEQPVLIGSATIDPRSGRMFWTVAKSANESYLTEVDLTTGAATKLYDFDLSRHVVGIFAEVPEAEAGAPAAVTDAAAAFEGASLEGSVSFTAPATCFDGSAADGSQTYRIFDDGVLLAEGSANAGAVVSVPVTLSATGDRDLILYTLNAAGASPKTHVGMFAGYGTPAAPQNVKAEADDAGIVTIIWDAVTTAADGGYINPADVRYTVTETLSGTVVATAVEGTSATFTSTATGMTTYTFSVTADNHGMISEAGVSNSLTLGSLEPPFFQGFDSEEGLTSFTTVDGNGDGKKWTFYTDRVRMGYNSRLAMDDWLITPPLHLEAGKSYYASFKARNENDRNHERVAAAWGSQPTAEAMTNVLVEPTDLSSKEYIELGGYITPTETGTYYFGIHGVSDADTYYLNVDDISVAAGVSIDAPAASTDMAITPDADGEYKATVSLKAPALTLGGGALAAITRIDVSRGETLVHTFDAPAPGASLSFTDELTEGGTFTYTAVAYNDNGAGAPVKASAYIGMPMASAPAAVSIVETEAGMVTLSWDKVATSADGAAINPDKVKYNVYKIIPKTTSWGSDEEELIDAGITANSYSFRAVEEGSQASVGYAVSAVTDFGETAHTASERIIVGDPYTDFAESWANGKASTVIITERINYGNWSIESSEWSTPTPQDADGGYMVMRGYGAGYSGALTTGKINLEGNDFPQFVFYSYTPEGDVDDLNSIAISVRSFGETEWTEVFNKTVVEMGATTGWHEVRVPLTGFAGKIVQIRMLATVFDRTYSDICIDNLSIGTMPGIDFEITGVSAPEYAKAGEPFSVVVSYMNLGAGNSEGHLISLLDGDGLILTTVEGEPAASMTPVTARISYVMPATATEAARYRVYMYQINDVDTENNLSDEFSIAPTASILPAPSTLKAIKGTGAVELSWQAPAMDEAPAEAKTEDFEGHTAWSNKSDSWFFLDIDKRPVGGFSIDIPGFTPGETSSFFVFETSGDFTGVTSFAAHSGMKYIAAPYAIGGPVDDWAVSPELSGEEQNISFYARSYSPSYPERIEVLYSTGSLNPADFQSTGTIFDAVPNEWTLCQATLPAGALHFALRSCASDPFFIQIDDVTFAPASTHGLTVDSYNVYRDGVQVNEAPVTATTFTDAVDTPDAHTWTVSAVYTRGESGMSNVASAESGIDGVTTSGIRIAGAEGQVIVTGAQGLRLTVAATDGKLLYDAAAADRTVIDLPSGIYIVTAGTTTAKVAVK